MLIKTDGLKKVFGTGEARVEALKNASFSIYAGEFVSIIGKSGSGKTTLMDILGLMSRPTAGDYFLEGSDVSLLEDTEMAKIRNKKIGFVFQSFNLLPRATALENVELPMVYSGISRHERRDKAMAALERVDLGNRASHIPAELSGGQKQRVAIARAIINNPEIILADEPTGNLDVSSSKDILNIFNELHDEGNTIIVITHDDDIAKIAQKRYVIDDGILRSGN